MKEVKNKFLFVFVIFLAGTAMLLGVFVFRQEAVRNAEEEIFSLPAPPSDDPEGAGNLSEEEAILIPPAPSASDGEKKAYEDRARKIAQKAEFLDITGCVAKPVVFHVPFGSSFTVKNQDSVEHRITHNTEYNFTVPAGGSAEAVADFSGGPGLYGYGCDGLGSMVGLILAAD